MTVSAITSGATVHVVGRGVVGARLARLLGDGRVIVHHGRWHPVAGVSSGDIVVLASGGPCAERAADLIGHGAHVITVTDDVDDTGDLLRLDEAARSAGVSLVVSAGVSPGLSGLMARSMCADFSTVDEVQVAVHGTAGRACARAHHRALSGWVRVFHDGEWVDRVAGSARQLAWFPEPIGAQDCYRNKSSASMLLHRVMPDVTRIGHRRSARRRDRLTAGLPMLTPPPAEGTIGGLRVELRGTDHDGGRLTLVHGIAELIGTATAATCAAFVDSIDDVGVGVVVPGDAALPNLRLLRRVTAYGVRLQTFTGVPQS